MLRYLTKTVVGVLVVAFMVRYVWTHAATMSDVRLRAAGWLVPATGLATIVLLLYARACQILIAAHGYRIRFSMAMAILYIPMLGKYVPGRVWSVLAALQLCRTCGIPAKVTTAYLTLFMAIGLGASSLIAVLFGLTSLGPQMILGAVVLLLLLMSGLYPPLFYGLLNWGLRLLRRSPIDFRASLRDLLHTAGLLVLGNAVYGCAFFFVVLSFGELPWSVLPNVVALFTFAQIAGFLAFFAPAGLGVREGVMLVGLQPLVGVGPAIAITAFARLWQTALELMMASIGWWTQRPASARGVEERSPC